MVVGNAIEVAGSTRCRVNELRNTVYVWRTFCFWHRVLVETDGGGDDGRTESESGNRGSAAQKPCSNGRWGGMAESVEGGGDDRSGTGPYSTDEGVEEGH